jgi:MerR family mercuric resistance operon transcriptional regulator
MRIGEVAKTAGVNIQALRFYERCGLLRKPARSKSGYRSYSLETVQIVCFIKQSQELGYTLQEIKQLLSLREKPDANSREVRAVVQSKLSEIERKITRLQQMYDELNQILNGCECGELTLRCPTLDNLNHKIT